jgi:hypothetical protein
VTKALKVVLPPSPAGPAEPVGPGMAVLLAVSMVVEAKLKVAPLGNNKA